MDKYVVTYANSQMYTHNILLRDIPILNFGLYIKFCMTYFSVMFSIVQVIKFDELCYITTTRFYVNPKPKNKGKTVELELIKRKTIWFRKFGRFYQVLKTQRKCEGNVSEFQPGFHESMTFYKKIYKNF